MTSPEDNEWMNAALGAPVPPSPVMWCPTCRTANGWCELHPDDVHCKCFADDPDQCDGTPIDLLAERERLRILIAAGIDAFRLTQEYVTPEVLPNHPGWSHFDWVQEAKEALND